MFETIQQQFLVEVTGDDAHPARHPVAGLEELNDLLDRWVRSVCHARVHSETGETPQARYQAAGPPARPEPALLREAFCWSVIRLVRKTATVALEGNVYCVDPFLTGRKVELVFDPLSQGRDNGSLGYSLNRSAPPRRPTFALVTDRKSLLPG